MDDIKNSIWNNDVEENLIYLAKFVNIAGVVSAVIWALFFIITDDFSVLVGIVFVIFILISTLISSNILKVLANISLTLKSLNGNNASNMKMGKSTKTSKDRINENTKSLKNNNGSYVKTGKLTEASKVPISENPKSNRTSALGISLFNWVREIETNEEFQVTEIFDNDTFLCVNAKNMDGKRFDRDEIEPLS